MNEQKVFKGNCFFNIGIIVFIAINIYLVYFFISQKTTFDLNNIIFVIFIDLLFLTLSSHSIFYFIVNDNIFQVKNYILFWYKKNFNFSEIQKVIIEPFSKAGTGLRIKTSTNKKHNFACDFVSIEKMAALAQILIHNGIEVEVNVKSIKNKMVKDYP